MNSTEQQLLAEAARNLNEVLRKITSHGKVGHFYSVNSYDDEGDYGGSDRKFDPFHINWRVLAETMAQEVGLRESAAYMKNAEAKRALEKRIDSSVLAFIEEICGTKYPGWWHGPHPHRIYEVASYVSLIANKSHGNVRIELLGVSAQLLERSFVTNGAVTKAKENAN